MSELATLARPYAVAIFKRAKEVSASQSWSGDLDFLCAVLGNTTVFDMVDNPKIDKAKKLSFLQSVCEGQVSQEGQNFLRLLIENNKLGLVSKITELYESYKAEDEGVMEVDVITAFDFAEDVKNLFGLALERRFGKKVSMKIAVDSSLIGGVLVRAGDQVMDASVRGQLQQLAQRLYI